MIQWYYLVLISSVLMALATIMEKRTLKAEHATQYSAAFSWIIALVSLIFLPFISFNLSTLQWLLLLVGSLLNSATYLISARVFKHGNLSVASPVYSSLPIFFIILLAYVFLGERLTLLQYVALAGIIVATYVLLFKRGKPSNKPDFESNMYRNFLIVNALLTAIGTIIGRYQLLNINLFSYIIIIQILTAIEFAIYITFKYGGPKEIIQTAKTYKYPLVGIVLLTLFYRLTYYYALSLPVASVSIATAIRNTLFIVITVVVAGSMFQEEGIKRKLLIGLLMVALSYILLV